MSDVWQDLRAIMAEARAVAQRTLFVGAGQSTSSDFPDNERRYLLDRSAFEREAYPAIAREVTRTVMSLSPRHVVAVDVTAAPGASLGDEIDTILEDGRTAATDAAVEAVLGGYGPELGAATFLDDAERPVARWTDDGQLAFSLPPAAIEELESNLPASVVEACRPA